MPHTAAEKKRVLTRVRRIQGQCSALTQALEAGAECAPVLQQIAAIRGAVAGLMAVNSCSKTCDPGYEGTDCKTETRAKILGSYHVTETCSVTGAAAYDVTITASGTDVTKVLVSPFGGYSGLTGTISVDGTTLTIGQQSSAGYTVVGSGTINNSGASLTVSYTITDSQNASETCPGTWTKQ